MKSLQVKFAIFVIFVLVTVLHPLSSLLYGREFLYSYRMEESGRGGVAIVEVNEETGNIGHHAIICEDSRLSMAKKVRYNAAADRVGIINEGEEPPFVFLSKTSPPSLVGTADVDNLCDELRVYKRYFVTSCDKGEIVLFKGVDGSEQKTFKAKKELSPPGNRPEDIVVLKNRAEPVVVKDMTEPAVESNSGNEVKKTDIAIVSFQKDNKSGKKIGNRIIALSLPELKLKGDVLIPRNHPELHVAGNHKLSGPGPEVLLVSEETNTVLTTLDFYGAIGMMDLDGVIKGNLKNYRSFSLDKEGKWGTAFPDRACLVNINGHHFALITNAGLNGGTNLIDLETRTIVRRFNTPPGLEAPSYLPSCMTAVSVCSGKTKYRKGNEIIKEYHPDKKLYTFDFSGLSGSDVSAITLSTTNIRIEGKALIGVNKETSPLVLISAKDTLLVVNAIDGEVIEKIQSIGIPQRFELKN